MLPHDKNTVCGYWFINSGTKDKLLDACAFHDKAYTEGSWHQKNLTRLEVDKWFLKQMLVIAGDDPTRILRAHAFYRIARFFGWMFWEGK